MISKTIRASLFHLKPLHVLCRTQTQGREIAIQNHLTKGSWSCGTRCLRLKRLDNRGPNNRVICGCAEINFYQVGRKDREIPRANAGQIGISDRLSLYKTCVRLGALCRVALLLDSYLNNHTIQFRSGDSQKMRKLRVVL